MVLRIILGLWTYVKDLISKRDWVLRRQTVEIMTFIKMLIPVPLMLLYQGYAGNNVVKWLILIMLLYNLADTVEKYETEYGSANLNEQEQFWTGLCFAKLLDFNGDGVDELILAYQTEPSNIDNVEYTVELWEFDGTSVERVASQISWTGNNIPYFGGFSISKYEEKYLLVLTDNAGGDISYYGTKDDGSIGLVHELIWKGDAMEGDWYLDDEMISRETYEEYYNKYRSDSIWYGFSEESCNETIQEEISQTKDKLKM